MVRCEIVQLLFCLIFHFFVYLIFLFIPFHFVSISLSKYLASFPVMEQCQCERIHVPNREQCFSHLNVNWVSSVQCRSHERSLAILINMIWLPMNDNGLPILIETAWKRLHFSIEDIRFSVPVVRTSSTALTEIASVMRLKLKQHNTHTDIRTRRKQKDQIK